MSVSYYDSCINQWRWLINELIIFTHTSSLCPKHLMLSEKLEPENHWLKYFSDHRITFHRLGSNEILIYNNVSCDLWEKPYQQMHNLSKCELFPLLLPCFCSGKKHGSWSRAGLWMNLLLFHSGLMLTEVVWTFAACVWSTGTLWELI